MTVPILTGDNVILREIKTKIDSIIWYEVMKDSQMHTWTGNSVPSNISEIIELLTLYKNHEELIAWSVIDKKNEKMIGTYWITKPILDRGKLIIHDEAQRIARNYWRSGYTKEARKLVYNFAFNELNVDEIHAHAFSENINSCKSMENIGFKLINSYERLFQKYNKIFKVNHYVLLKDKWLEIKKN